MKKIFGITTLLVGAALLTAGCTSDNLEQQGQKGNKPIQLAVTTVELDNSAIADGNTWSNSTTRALESSVWTAFANGDAIKAYILKNSDGSAVPGTESGSGWTTYSYNGTAWTANPVAYYPGDYSNVDLTAIYPSTVATNATSFSVLADQTTAANYKASDLLTYKGTDLFPEATLPVAMEHKLARIKVKINTASTVAVTGIAINNVNLTTGTFSPTAGTVASASAGTSTVTILSGTATENVFYCGVIPPQTHAASALITLTTASGNVTYTLGATKAFDSGKEYTLDLTVNTAAIGTTINIGTWGTSTNVTVNPTVETGGVVAVDLGLSVKWASMNVGASCETDYGMYFAWGDIIGYSPAISSGTTAADGHSFSWATYTKHTNGTYSDSNKKVFTKYVPAGQKETYWYGTGDADDKTTLEAVDDAATANWGGSWRMPTEAEWTELKNNCTWTWTGSGYTVTSKTNSNSIFLPAAGNRHDASFHYQESYGFYWSSSLFTGSPYYAKYLYFYSSSVSVNFNIRCNGFTVRPVLKE